LVAREMAAFAENELGILPDYFPVQPVAGMSAALSPATPAQGIPPPAAFASSGLSLTTPERQRQERASGVHAARRRVLSLLQREVSSSLTVEQVISQLEQISDAFMRRQFGAAKAPLDRLRSAPAVTGLATIDNATLAKAVSSAPMSCLDIKIRIVGREPHEREVATKVPRTLPGYTGPRPGSGGGELLSSLTEFLSGGPERRFRLGLLEAERLAGLARAEAADSDPEALYREAIRAYAALLPAGGSAVNPQQRLVVLRSASTQVALADFLYRRAFRPAPNQRDEIEAIYSSALEFLVGHGLGTDTFAALGKHIDQQLERLHNGVNSLGFTDAYVPDRRLTTLSERAHRRIDAATAASVTFRELERGLDEVTREIALLTQTQLEDRLGVDIAKLRLENAKAQEQNAIEQKRLIETKLSDLDAGLAAGVAQSLFATFAFEPGGAEVGGTVNGPGLTSAIVGYLAARNELGHQARIAELGRQIAIRDEQIAGIETDIATSRVEFVQDAIDARRFRANRLYVLTNAWEELTRRNVAAALEFLFEFERGIAFRRLVDLDVVQSVSGDAMLAPGELLAVHNDLMEAADPDEPGQSGFPLPPISLKSRYPLEFSRFRQTGAMEFVISLYDVEQRMHLSGHRNIRIKDVSVELPGALVPPTGFIGSLAHRGVMMFRDREATMTEPRPTRLVPTDAELEAAADELARGTAQRAIVGGVALLALDQDTRRISSEPDQPFPSDQLDFGLEPIENYGLTGTWVLQIDDLNLRTVDDVLLRFTVSLDERDPALQERVEELISAYEDELRGADDLDRILAVDLKGRSPDAYFALASGTGSFELRDEDFEPTITDLQVKTAVMQALDEDRAGVAGITLELSRADSPFTLTRTTGDDGFSEDLDREIPTVPPLERPPVVGAWRIRLPEDGQFALMGEAGDLRLFFLYGFNQA
jgi:hypothetical protein